MSQLQQKYQKQAIPAMREKFGYKNNLAVPKITKVVVNTGIGRIIKDENLVNSVIDDLSKITGQKPVFTLAKKAISGFKIRKGMKIGLKVTLRGKRMYDFLEKLIGVTLPRTRDFRGLPLKSIDQKGNLNIGIKEQIVFPEIANENVKLIFGLEVAIITNTENREEATELFRLLGFPLRK